MSPSENEDFSTRNRGPAAYYRHDHPPVKNINYPFILLNLMLSFQAAYTGPIVMMSHNRQAEKDRLQADHHYQINLKAEDEIQVIMKHLEYQDNFIQETMTGVKKLQERVAGLERKIEEVMQRFDERAWR